MERDVAVRLDGMLIGARGNLDGIAHYMKGNLPREKYSQLIRCIGESMSALIDISDHLHSEFPDIVPKELQPPRASE
jgi:hypothetical protein